MELDITTPTILFPVIGILMLVYSSRFLGLATLVRALVKQYEIDKNDDQLRMQIKYLNVRLNLIRNMEICGATSLLCSMISIYLVCMKETVYSHIFFAISVIVFSISLVMSLIEIYYSNKALKIVLKKYGPKNYDEKVDI